MKILKLFPGIILSAIIAVFAMWVESLLPIHLIGSAVIAMFVGMFLNKIISKTFLGSTIRYKIGTNKTKNGILIVDKSSNDSEVFNPGDYVKINILQDWQTEP